MTIGDLTARQQRNFWNRVEVGPDCWIWKGAIHKIGYGTYSFRTADGTKTWGPHQIAYQLIRGGIPKGLELDHLCRNRLCVNPAHLEAVTHTENMRRTRADRCHRGHPFTEKNTYYWRHKRYCRTCHLASNRASARRVALRRIRPMIGSL